MIYKLLLLLLAIPSETLASPSRFPTMKPTTPRKPQPTTTSTPTPLPTRLPVSNNPAFSTNIFEFLTSPTIGYTEAIILTLYADPACSVSLKQNLYSFCNTAPKDYTLTGESTYNFALASTPGPSVDPESVNCARLTDYYSGSSSLFVNNPVTCSNATQTCTASSLANYGYLFNSNAACSALYPELENAEHSPFILTHP